jgi:hypothetical protein
MKSRSAIDQTWMPTGLRDRERVLSRIRKYLILAFAGKTALAVGSGRRMNPVAPT